MEEHYAVIGNPNQTVRIKNAGILTALPRGLLCSFTCVHAPGLQIPENAGEPCKTDNAGSG